MTRYAELYRQEQDEKRKLEKKLERQILALIADRNLLRDFILENNLQDRLAQWALDRTG